MQDGRFGWAEHIVEFFAIGTDVVATRADHQILSPEMVLSLNDQ